MDFVWSPTYFCYIDVRVAYVVQMSYDLSIGVFVDDEFYTFQLSL